MMRLFTRVTQVVAVVALLASPAVAEPDFAQMQAQRRALLQHGPTPHPATDGRQRPRLPSAYDIVQVEVDFTAPRGGLLPEEGRITAQITLNDAGVDTLPLIAFFFAPLNIELDGVPLDFMHDPQTGELLVFLGPRRPGPITLVMDVSFGGYCQDATGCIERGEQQHLAQIGWYPLNAEVGPDDYFNVTLNIRVTDGRVVAGTGTREAPRQDGDATLWRFTTTRETILPAFALGPNRISPVNDVVEVYLPPRTIDDGRFIGRVATQTLDLYEGLLGPYPFTRLGISPIANEAGVGLGPQANILLPEAFWQFPADGSAEADVLAQVTAHEIAHQYFFNLVHIIDNTEGWMSEAFAEYSATRYSEVREGDTNHARMNYWDYMLGVPTNQDAAVNSDEVNRRPGDIRQRIIYFKGSSVLHQLRQRLPEFDAHLAAWIEAFSGQIVTTEDFIDFISNQSGTDIRPFIAQWIRRPGHPFLQVSVQRPRDGSDAVDVQVSQFQDGRQFNASLPVVAHFEGGDIANVGLRIEADGPQTLDVGLAQWLDIDPELSLFRRIVAEPAADVNLSGVVDGMDLLDTLANTGLTAPHPRWNDVLDVDRNLTIDRRDAAQVIDGWGGGW